MDYYREYMTKNTIAFEKGRTNSDGNDEWEPMYLFPKGYPYEKLEIPDDRIVLTDDSAFW